MELKEYPNVGYKGDLDTDDIKQTVFDIAVNAAKANNESKWLVAKAIFDAVEEAYTVREIALAVDGSYDKVMTYTNYLHAHEMREVVRTVNSDKLAPLYNLPISYWWTAHSYLMKNVDIEYIIDILFDCILDDNKLRGQRWLDYKLSEFAGDEDEDYKSLIKNTRKWITRFSNGLYSISDSMNVQAAQTANHLLDLLGEMEGLLDDLGPK